MMKMNNCWALVGLVAAVGCGGGDDDGDGGGDMVSVEITAAAGGEVEIGEASLTIPAGALAEDTTITAATSEPSGFADADTLTGLAYDFGPDGTTFLTPVTLELPVVGSPGEGEEAVLSWYDGTAWHDEPTTVAGGTASAQIMHFTTFIVRFRGVESLDCSFSPCGGDIVGAWDIAGVCISFADSNPFEQFCPTAVIDVVIDGTGVVTFGSDQSFDVSLNITGDLTLELPPACTSTAQQCEGMFGTEPDDLQCSGEPATGCTCTQVINNQNTDTGTYTTSGSSLTITQTGEQPNAQEYCVDGDTLKVQDTEDDDAGATFVYSATRQ